VLRIDEDVGQVLVVDRELGHVWLGEFCNYMTGYSYRTAEWSQVMKLATDLNLVVQIHTNVAEMQYLAETFPEADLAPAVGDKRRGEFLTWMAWYVAELEPAMFAGLGGELAGSPQKQRNFDAVVRRLEGALAQRHYVVGEGFSAADFLISSALDFARRVFPASDVLDAYLDRCRTRPAAIRGVALDNASGPQGAA